MDYTVSEERIALLQAHFFEFSFDGRAPDRMVFEAITNPVEYHLIAANYNWDDGPEVLTWIVTSSLCDRATAQLIFWRAQPSFYTRFTSVEAADYEAAVYTLLRTIMQQWEAGAYPSTFIAYDPRTDAMAEDIDYQDPQEKWAIPAYLKQPTVGELDILLE
jgi:hypothetical protein